MKAEECNHHKVYFENGRLTCYYCHEDVTVGSRLRGIVKEADRGYGGLETTKFVSRDDGMTELQINKAKALGKCIFPVGSGQKRFAHQMAYFANVSSERELTPRQSAYLDLLFHQYRRQIPKSHRLYCDCKTTGRKLSVVEVENT